MENNNELNEINIKNGTCYYFDDIMRVGDFGFCNILLDKKFYENSFENILIYNTSCQTFMGEKSLCIRFNKIDGFIKIYDRTMYLALFGPERYDAIYDRIRDLINEKGGITDSVNHNFGRIRIDLCSSLPIEKVLTFHNVILLIKSVVNENKNNYYYKIFLEKGSYEDRSNTH